MFFRHKCGSDNHKFEPRYDTLPPDNLESLRMFKAILVGSIVLIIEAMTKKVYAGDICIKCGTVRLLPRVK